MSRLITPEVLYDLLDWLAQCAGTGERCPSNQDICDRYGFGSWASAAKAMKMLESDGSITVLRGRTTRQVTIIATGAQTAPVTHMGRARRQPAAPAKQAEPEPAPVIPLPPRGPAPKGHQCQWIDGKPTADDACKCRAWTVNGTSWCSEHLDRIYRKPGDVPAGYRVAAK